MFPKNILPELKNAEVEKFVPDKSIESLYRDIEDKNHTALLKTGKTITGHHLSIIGSNPFLIFQSKGRDITIYGKELYRLKGSPFTCLQKIIDNYSKVELPHDLPFPAGALGAFSYDLKHIIEDIPDLCTDDINCPDMHFSFFSEFIIADETKGDFYKLNLDTGRTGPPPGLIRGEKPRRNYFGGLKSNFEKEEYKEAVRKVIRYIKEGTIYQANISQQFRAGFIGDSFLLFEALNRTNPAPMSAYLNCGDFKIISSSPERFLLKKGSCIESRPIKGTRPRGKNTFEDLELRQELIKSEKDSAELAMIVDLIRNDLGKTAQPGTVAVSAPRIIEEYTNVFHSLAIVTSMLRDDANPLELIRSCFPGGSVTGCPKVQAMKVIEEIEKNRRGFYCGSIGYIGFNGNFDMSIAIRTFIEKNEHLYFNLGGGIVYDSDPQAEYEETIHKGETMFRILNMGG